LKVVNIMASAVLDLAEKAFIAGKTPLRVMYPWISQ
jgi:hypothetical protein